MPFVMPRMAVRGVPCQVLLAVWAWSWLTFKRGARLITGEVPKLPAVTTIGADGKVTLPVPAHAVLPARGERLRRETLDV